MTAIYYEAEDGSIQINDQCLDCDFSYVEDIWGDVVCKMNKCPFEEEETNG